MNDKNKKKKKKEKREKKKCVKAVNKEQPSTGRFAFATPHNQPRRFATSPFRQLPAWGIERSHGNTPRRTSSRASGRRGGQSTPRRTYTGASGQRASQRDIPPPAYTRRHATIGVSNSQLLPHPPSAPPRHPTPHRLCRLIPALDALGFQIGRASCRERVS